ncbi:hypothetical protein ACHAWF_005614 [Thalassiosira exigua]
MMKQLPDGDADVGEKNSGTVSNSMAVSAQISGDRDIEMGTTNHSHSVGSRTENEATGEDVEYTHVMIPLPGYDIDGILVKDLDDAIDDEKKPNSLKRKIFSRKPKDNEPNDDKEESEADKEASDSEDDVKEEGEKRTEKRSVPIFCAVCLMEFGVSERVCWASNGECTHVFHEDCILQWLITLGRKRSKKQSFPRNPSEKRLLNYDLACPCCRQPFMSKKLIGAPDSGDSV